MTGDWDGWFASRPGDLDEFEAYTATLLHTLWQIRESAPLAWGLTGGTALQSFFEAEKRRYSSDLEIITRATKAEVIDWMRRQDWKPRPVGNAPILVARLTPDGTLFVIHDYPQDGFEATSPTDARFRHYPIAAHPPPGELEVPILDYEFLVATKIYGVRDPTRGGERFKDAHDLSLALPDVDEEKLPPQLSAYLRIRNDPTASSEIVRQAGVWLRFLADAGVTRFEQERRRFIREDGPFDAAAELQQAAKALERLHGSPITPTASEGRRLLLYDVSVRALGRVATKLGYTGSRTKEFEKMADFVATRAFPKLPDKPPATAEDLLAELEDL